MPTKRFSNILNRWYIRVVLVLSCIVILYGVFFSNLLSNKKIKEGSAVTTNTSVSKKIKEVPGVTFDNITSIGLQYDSMKYPAVKVNDTEKIKEFMNRLDKFTLKKRAKQENLVGYYLVAVFYSGDSEVFSILFMGDFIEIGFPDGNPGTQYTVTEGNLSFKDLDKFVLSVK